MAARLTAYVVATIVGATLIAGLIVGAQRDEVGPVDLIIVNGHVYTGQPDDRFAEAVAIQGNKILAVGSNAEIRRLRRAQTEVIDADGGSVLPGFDDAHVHFLSGGLGLTGVDLSEAATAEAVAEAIGAWAGAHPDRAWVAGRGWYYDAFPGGMPTRQALDAVVPDRPAYLEAFDGHTAWVNSAALAAAGITRRTPNPPNGIIGRDPRSGEPSGVLKEAAMGLVERRMPAPSADEKLDALRAAIRQANRLGVTSVQNASGTADELELYDALRRSGELSVRVYAALSADGSLDEKTLARFDALRRRFPDDPLFKTGSIKLILDGVVESFTAALLEPYATNPRESGTPTMTPATLQRIVRLLDRDGWQILIHAIGDRSVRMALDAYEQAAAANPAPPRGRRHRIEHIETLDPADIPRFAELGVVASMQPYHAVPVVGPSDVWTANLGPERARRGWMFETLRTSGARLAFGSDWPVATLDPLPGLHVAVNRTTLEGLPDGGLVPEERLALAAAIDASTRNAAWASFDEHRKGVLDRDMLADVVILTEDIFDLPPERLTDAVVRTTIFDGKVVYERSSDSTTH
ncbi:MAG: amidohydrolase [Vicinamibacterales bacterium]